MFRKYLFFIFVFLVGCEDSVDKNSSEYREQLLINASKSICQNEQSLNYIAWRDLNGDSKYSYSLIYNEDGVYGSVYKMSELNIKPYCKEAILKSYLKVLDDRFVVPEKHENGYITIGKKSFKADSIISSSYNSRIEFENLDDEYYSYVHIKLINGDIFNFKYKEQKDAIALLKLLGQEHLIEKESM